MLTPDLAIAGSEPVSEQILSVPSHRPGLEIRIRHQAPARDSLRPPVLFIHGSSFPSGLSFAFRMDGLSWMDHLNHQGFHAYALDFLGYGLSDRYPEMGRKTGIPPGRASAVYLDIAIAADLMLARSRHKKLILIAHSWGGTAAAMYAEKFPDRVEKLVLYATITPRQSSSPHEAIARTFEAMAPETRVAQMDRLAPPGPKRQLAPAVLDHWGDAWRRSDSAQEWAGQGLVRFPSGPSADIEALNHGRSCYCPEELRSPVLIVRGDQDTYPSDEDAQLLRKRMTKVSSVVYRVIHGGTHVMHLETRRRKLYEAVDSFIR